MSMTYYERVHAAIGGEESPDLSTELSELLMFAYWHGREDGARIVSDMATARFRIQQEAAKNCRYHKMAEKIVGDADPWTHGQGFVYSPDYAGSYSGTCGGEIWDGE